MLKPEDKEHNYLHKPCSMVSYSMLVMRWVIVGQKEAEYILVKMRQLYMETVRSHLIIPMMLLHAAEIYLLANTKVEAVPIRTTEFRALTKKKGKTGRKHHLPALMSMHLLIL